MGPLAGMKVVEFAAVGPAPMCAMLLADMGATVLRIDRAQAGELGNLRALQFDFLRRGRHSVTLDLKSRHGLALALDIVAGADALIEGLRPGVMERLGLGPAQCLERSPGLVYGRVTGWGQDGPLAQVAAHDLNYIALTGALDVVGQAGGPPLVPLNLLGDFAGGSLYLALGILAAFQEKQRSGKGQVVDAAVVDGVSSLMTSLYGSLAAGQWKLERGSNLTDGGAPFYNVYECADGKHVSIAPIETRFYELLLERAGIDAGELRERWNRAGWPAAKAVLGAAFKTRTRAEWCDLLEGSDCCFAPVLSMDEVAQHPHMRQREVLVEVDGLQQPAPAPRFSRSTPQRPSTPKATSRAEALVALNEWLGPQRYADLDPDALAAVQGSSGGA
ncbi:CaiB/BaiF CoA-transferase family protein [soil metagenome]